MTKVQLQYELTHPLDDRLLESISRVHGVYGMSRVTVSADNTGLDVEFDASRLNTREVGEVLLRAGLPVKLRVPAI